MRNKFVIFWFSGTGNAKRIAQWIYEFCFESEIECELFDISKFDIKKQISINEDSCIILISPTHGFNYPQITLKFISGLQKGNNEVFLMSTRAGMRIGNWITPGLSGITFYLSWLILKTKGYGIRGIIPFDMPSNWISIHPAIRKNDSAYIHKIIKERVKKHTRIIIEGKNDFAGFRDIVQDILIAPISILYYFIGRYFLAKTFYASDLCNLCYTCVEKCPVNAIKIIDNHPFWTLKCESCMKCMNNCPEKAIETSHGLIAIYLLIYLLIGNFIGQFFFDITRNSIFHWLLINIFYLSLYFIIYRLQHYFLKLKFIGKFIRLSSLTYYKFWGRYKSKTTTKSN